MEQSFQRPVKSSTLTNVLFIVGRNSGRSISPVKTVGSMLITPIRKTSFHRKSVRKSLIHYTAKNSLISRPVRLFPRLQTVGNISPQNVPCTAFSAMKRNRIIEAEARNLTNTKNQRHTVPLRLIRSGHGISRISGGL